MAESNKAGSDGEKPSRLSCERRSDSSHNEELASNDDSAELSKCSSSKNETVPRRLFQMVLFSANRKKSGLTARGAVKSGASATE